MMKLSALKVIAEVLANYGDESVSAEHDEIFFGGPSPDEIGDIHKQLLDNAGAFWSDEYECWKAFV